MGIPSIGLKFGGNVRPNRFCKLDASNARELLEADANEIALFISRDATRDAPITGQSTYAGVDGDPAAVYGQGEIAYLYLGTGGASAGGRLKSDADGKGVPIATTGTDIQHICAIALETRLVDELCPVLVHYMSERPALS